MSDDRIREATRKLADAISCLANPTRPLLTLAEIDARAAAKMLAELLNEELLARQATVAPVLQAAE